jgi:hypothetical protein
MRNAFNEDNKDLPLLRCTRAYIEMDILASFDVHTDVTIQQGRIVAKKFVKLANVSDI